MSSIHPDISDRLLPYLDGQLEEGLRREVQEHLESCRPCSEELASIRAIVLALRQDGQAERVAGAPADRYACPGPEDLTAHVLGEAGRQAEEGGWIARHLAACVRCRREADLILQMGTELSAPGAPAVPDDLFARVVERLMARVRQVHRGDERAPIAACLRALSERVLLRAALGMGLAAAIAVLGVRYLHPGRPVTVAKRAPGEDVLKGREVRVPPAPPSQETAQERSPRKPSALARVEPSVPSTARPPASSPPGETATFGEATRTPGRMTMESPSHPPPRPPSSVVAKVEAPLLPPPASGVPFRLDAPLASKRGGPLQAAPAMPSRLPPLVPAKQGEPLKVLILPITSYPALRASVAAGLQEQLETVQPTEREFPAEPSVDDLGANRRLGRMFGVRYVLGIDVTKARSGYLIALRAADTETGGLVATRQGLVQDEGALPAAATRLAKELQQELRARP